jgi:hypothetical protein
MYAASADFTLSRDEQGALALWEAEHARPYTYVIEVESL